MRTGIGRHLLSCAMKVVKYLFLLFALFLGITISGQELPPVQNFAPSDYEAENQNWAISQSAGKEVFIANNKGLLAYNGAAWTLYTSPNETIMRSAKVVGERIYSGYYMEFGFWEADEFGVLNYTSLSETIRSQLEEDEEFWTILNVDNYILFQSLKRIYAYDIKEHTVNILAYASNLPKMFSVDKGIYYQKIGEGLFKIENGKEVLVFKNKVVQQDEVASVFSKNGILHVLTRHNGFYREQEGILAKWATPSEGLFEEISVYSGLALSDGSYALGTIAHGLIILDAEGNLKYRLDELNGLRNNTVLSLFQDMDQNLWLGLDNGVAYVNLDSPFRVYHDNSGVVGSVYTAIVRDGLLYLGTNQGLFYKPLDDNNGFTFIKGTQGQVWSLDEIQGTLFCGHHEGTFIIEGGEARQILDIPGTWKIGEIKEGSGMLLQGNYSGLYVLHKVRGQWQLKHKIKGFDNSARFFEVFDDEIFVNHEYKGIFRINVDAEFTEAKSIAIDTTLIGANSGMVKYKEELLYACQQGVFKYDRASETFLRDSLISTALDANSYLSGKLIVDNTDGYLWMFSNSGIHYLSNGSLNSTPRLNEIPISARDRNSIVGYESVTALPEPDSYLFGIGSGYISADISVSFDKEFQVGISNVRKTGKNKVPSGDEKINTESTGAFENEENNLEISYYTAEFNKFLRPQYQYRLEGIYPNWSPWSDRTTASFENLPYGNYSFEVRARVGNKLSSGSAEYTFSIARPWYLSNMMWGVYFFSFILISLIVHNTYRLYYRKKQRKLQEENKREMQVVKLQNEKEIIKIKNDQLQEDFKNKSNELAASTMSIIKKNQLLSQVKEQLMAGKEDSGSVKKIVEIIDRNLKQNDDWELFKEAFNNADREFLKKLEQAHPNLTPNDIRLCSYLRLNLSSKEMAQLLNISTRSVEIKRYRLRKKLNLMHDENLVSYILRL